MSHVVVGTPHDDYYDHMVRAGFDVILVMPWRQIWLIDTLAGLITLLVATLLFIAVCIGVAVYCCKRAGVCCFKP